MSWSFFVRTAEQCLVWGRREGLVVLVFKLVVLRGFLSIFFVHEKIIVGKNEISERNLGAMYFALRLPRLL